MANFTYSDVVRVVADADDRFRPNARAWVIGVFPKMPSGSHFDSFPGGAVYAIEFDDGEAIDIPESLLEPHRVVLEPARGSGHRVSTIRLALALAAALMSSLFCWSLGRGCFVSSTLRESGSVLRRSMGMVAFALCCLASSLTVETKGRSLSRRWSIAHLNA